VSECARVAGNGGTRQRIATRGRLVDSGDADGRRRPSSGSNRFAQRTTAVSQLPGIPLGRSRVGSRVGATAPAGGGGGRTGGNGKRRNPVAASWRTRATSRQTPTSRCRSFVAPASPAPAAPPADPAPSAADEINAAAC
jgi:hypothetical protein